MKRLYVDHAATTPPLPEVAEAMRPWLAEEFGNPSSLHAEGRRARQALDQARETLSERLGCLFGEVIFTSSGTEAANLALMGVALEALATGSPRRRVLIGAAEHHCVLHAAEPLRAIGFRVELIPVDRFSVVRPEALRELLDDDTLLVSVMRANNETGALNPIPELAALAQEAGALFHADAVQTFGSRRETVDELGVDLLSASAHKINGPKAAGFLYVRSGVLLKPWAVGGGQERDLRAGTENVAAIVGFAEAVRRIEPTSTEARDAFWEEIGDAVVRTLPAEAPCLPGHAHFRVPGLSAEKLLIKLDRLGLSASSGAACSSGSVEPSHVLLACGFSPAEAAEGVRFSFGRGQSAADGRRAAELLLQAVAEMTAPRG